GLASMVEFQGTRWFSDKFREAHPSVVDEISAIFGANDVECYSSTCIMMGDADLRPLLPSITVPVAIVVGEDDYATPVSMSRQLHEAIAGSTLKIIPRARHLTPIEVPQEICAQLLALLERKAAAASLAPEES
ncbi:alpha/beta fold hydrolase, partial [Steroidobacter sp.]|uniref:alpha/beta fold hydrolase n=1 Tax=Steroidobacter sp. TaxID=1978227 RepID=UPI001A5FB661